MKELGDVQPKKLSKDQLRASRKGKLGRFPSGDLYEPEAEEEESRDQCRDIKTATASETES
jgi:hypothetical protein